ncbi:hypothetical protein NITLEN_11100 [Nitrospira lenta]|uniref:Uncharacterized protein n=1 Tax=Nitrospira lenta TaxID=1436998 RepID=A0A330L2Z7_9BACT|nr:hypothetical protein NITLEN_11100 [Nitrospira lenta]
MPTRPYILWRNEYYCAIGSVVNKTFPEREEFLLIGSMEGKYLLCQRLEPWVRGQFTPCVQGEASF